MAAEPAPREPRPLRRLTQLAMASACVLVLGGWFYLRVGHPDGVSRLLLLGGSLALAGLMVRLVVRSGASDR